MKKVLLCFVLCHSSILFCAQPADASDPKGKKYTLTVKQEYEGKGRSPLSCEEIKVTISLQHNKRAETIAQIYRILYESSPNWDSLVRMYEKDKGNPDPRLQAIDVGIVCFLKPERSEKMERLLKKKIRMHFSMSLSTEPVYIFRDAFSK